VSHLARAGATLGRAGVRCAAVPVRGPQAGSKVEWRAESYSAPTRVFTAAVIARRPASASAKNMPVFGSVYSSLSIPA
jgi:hypothetical protein